LIKVVQINENQIIYFICSIAETVSAADSLPHPQVLPL
jgi:hypothetical protein